MDGSSGATTMGAMPVAGARPLDGLPPVDQQQPHGGTGHAVTSDTGHFRAYHILRRFAAAALCRISTEDERHHARTALVREQLKRGAQNPLLACSKTPAPGP